MSISGLDLRKRLRRRVVRLLDGLVARLEQEEAPATTATSAPSRPPPPSPAPPPAATVRPPRLEPLPDLPKRPAPLGAQGAAATVTAPTAAAPTATAPAGGATPAAEKARVSPEERQKQHWDRTRKGILRFVHDHDGRAGLRELHDHSERTYFVAHVGFSRLMEELTGEGLLAYDHDTAVASITDAGRAALAD